jgi:uncharacterized repeat protein (TIGR03803 family)
MRSFDVQLVRGSVGRLLVLSLALAAALATAPSAVGQTFRVIHTFSGSADGSTPSSTMVMDQAGSLYGTTSYGGAQPGFAGFGIVFKLVQRNSAWLLTPFYTFQGGSDGAYPGASVVIGPNGILYGTTSLGGNPGCPAGMGCGTVYQLQPRPRACQSVLCPWTKTVLYRFTGGQDGANPAYGQLIFDHSGNIYGTTGGGGDLGSGVVYQLTRSSGGWQESVLHSFDGTGDGLEPQSGVVFDSQGNLYGTTVRGGAQGNGTVYELSPSQSGWGISKQYDIANEGSSLYAGVILDQLGNLYGATSSGGPGNGGTVFQLAPSGGQWSSTIIGRFSPLGGQGLGAFSSLAIDGAGNLYGTTETDGAHGFGSVFKLVLQNGSWVQTTLYDFAGGSDGCNPSGAVTVAPQGHLYGTAQGCGAGYGVVWEITP